MRRRIHRLKVVSAQSRGVECSQFLRPPFFGFAGERGDLRKIHQSSSITLRNQTELGQYVQSVDLAFGHNSCTCVQVNNLVLA